MAEVYHQHGKSLSKNGQFEAAIQKHKQALDMWEKRKDVIGCGGAHRMIGECFLELGDWESSLTHNRAFLELAQSTGNYGDEQRAWLLIGRSYLFRHTGDKSQEALGEAQEAFVRSLEVLDGKLEGSTLHKLSALDLKKMRVGLYLNLGIVCNLLRDGAHGMEYIEQSIGIAQENNLFTDLHRANYYLASVHQADGHYSQALDRLEEARQNARKARLVAEESDCLASMGEVNMMCGNFSAANLQLAEALSLAPPTHRDRDKMKKHLQRAMKGIELQASLSRAQPHQHSWRMKIYEKLGDLSCKVMDYQKGLEYYQKQLECTEVFPQSGEELAVIHFSLGSTCFDLKDYKQAINHYKTELTFHKDRPREVCKTWLHIAAAQRQDGAERSVLDQCYHNALQHAQLAQEPRLQRKVLRELRKSQRNLSSSLEGEEGTTTDSDSEEGTEMEDGEVLDRNQVKLSAKEDTRATSSKCGEGWVTRKQRWKRNMKGESPLHRACISGSFKLASSLIDQGHPLILRDYAGWTPLHEACNHGHLDIVRLLLDSGAPVNSLEDTMCDGISPLHDALTNGQLEVTELLIDRGACLTGRDSEGRTPADCCRQWSRDVKVEPRPETGGKCAAVLSILEDALLHINTTIQTDPGPELKPLVQSSQYLHGKDSGECSLPSSSLESPDSTLTSSHWLSEGHGDGAVFPTSRSRAKVQRRGRLLRSKRKGSADLSQAATARLVSSSSRWSSEDDDDFISSPRPCKKQRIRVGQRSSADQKGPTASSGNISSHLLPSSVEQREKSTGRSANTPSEPSQSSMSTGKSSSKSGQSSRSTGKSSSKFGQSSMSTGKSSSKSGQSSMSTGKSSSKSGQSSMSTGKSSSKSGQPSTRTTLLFDNQAQLFLIGPTAQCHAPAIEGDGLAGR
ncbi:tonsoku-like protein [Scyliorhinus torazame]|uniref:tonsoku-like protein n=1 Tax=Scyliorhinus torazame TaxID=75743 RepID=UPI003B5BED17